MTTRINETRYEGRDGTGEGFVLTVRRRADAEDDRGYAVRLGYAEDGWRDPLNIVLWLSEEQVRTLGRMLIDAAGGE